MDEQSLWYVIVKDYRRIDLSVNLGPMYMHLYTVENNKVEQKRSPKEVTS